MYPSGGQRAPSVDSFGIQPALIPAEGENMTTLVTTLTIATQLVLSHVLRGRLSEVVRNELLKGCLLELVAAAEMCGVSYELGFVFERFGMLAWSACVFLLILWREQSWGATTACPYTLLEQYVESGDQPLHVLLKTLAQIIGALISCRWVKQLWMLGAAEAPVECTADLQVPVVLGFLIEAVLTCACRLFSRVLGELQPKFASIVDSFFTTSMVILAFNYSGGYFNPVLATGLKWSCRGHTNAEHIVVYWAGSILGAMLSLRLWTMPTLRARILAPFKSKNKSQ